MPIAEPTDTQYAERIAASFARQTIMTLIGANLLEIAPGVVTITLPYRADLCQQHGFLHAGIITSIIDTACGFAALSLMPADTGVLSVEFKLNLLAPAVGDMFLAHGKVVRAGRTITVCTGEVIAMSGAKQNTIALMQATMMAVHGREGIKD
jgi:uncharacterized protein (TIGR00369 family)